MDESIIKNYHAYEYTLCNIVLRDGEGREKDSGNNYLFKENPLFILDEALKFGKVSQFSEIPFFLSEAMMFPDREDGHTYSVLIRPMIKSSVEPTVKYRGKSKELQDLVIKDGNPDDFYQALEILSEPFFEDDFWEIYQYISTQETNYGRVCENYSQVLGVIQNHLNLGQFDSFKKL